MTDPIAPPGPIPEQAPARERYAAQVAGLHANVNAALGGGQAVVIGVEVGRFILQVLRDTGAGPTSSELAAHLGILDRFPPPADVPATWHRRWEMAAVSVTVGVLRMHGFVTYSRQPRSLRTGPAFYPAMKAADGNHRPRAPEEARKPTVEPAGQESPPADTSTST